MPTIAWISAVLLLAVLGLVIWQKRRGVWRA